MDHLTPRYTQLIGSGMATFSKDDDDLNVRRLIIGMTLSFTLFVYMLESYLSYRQRCTYKLTSFPKELELAVGNIDAEEEERRGKRDTGGGGTEVNSEKKLGDEVYAKKGEEEEENNTATSTTDTLDRSSPLLPQLRSKFLNAQSYGLDRVNFSLISSSYSTIEGITFVLLGYMPYVWDMSCRVGKMRGLGYDERTDEIKISLIFMLLTTILGMITGLPFELYSTFRIEKRHGFNKTTIGLFITDKVKGLLLGAFLGGPFVALLLKIIIWGGERFYIYVWGFTFVFSLFMMTLYPVVIMPMFNTYEALPPGELKDRIYALADKLHFPLTKLFVMDGSKRSSHSNAFMFGFFKNKRIVLFDTLLKQVHDDEILAILGHELGHWKMGHTVTNFVISQLYTGAAFYAFSLCYNSHELYRAFGFDDDTRTVPTIIALLLFFGTVWEPIDKVISYGMTVHSRKCEFEADEFSSRLGMGRTLRSGLCKIHLENLGAMCPDPWYSAYHYSHPPLVERLSAMMRLDEEEKKTL
ncbi:hypothetical protein ACHAXA_003038 [Cyclostephanos tholiformis]|uniref:Ste24 endopeptidase n=1 Tax=Cyclostephanos tholiformis TaxID=382380 RepID=A0ABD3RH87_9STRA